MSKTRIAVAWAAAMIFAAGIMTYFPIMAVPRTVRRFLNSEPVHIVAHLFLFAVLAALIAGRLWRGPTARRLRGLLNWRTLLVLLLIFGVGVLQETAQLIGRHLPAFRAEEVFDLGVDLVGACIGLVIFHRRRAQHPT
ncbi:MAG: hypothetical protein JXB47_04065 [Anaerolineae bacterium]|nr:hypothetical protein [Anaerolineae bacterium]